MTNEEITGKILGMFSEDMDPESRRLLIKMYEVCSNKDWNDEPICSLIILIFITTIFILLNNYMP